MLICVDLQCVCVCVKTRINKAERISMLKTTSISFHLDELIDISISVL